MFTENFPLHHFNSHIAAGSFLLQLQVTLFTEIIGSPCPGMTMILFAALLLVLCAAVNAQGCPTIISRAQWGGKTPTCKKMSTPVPYVIIHHTEAPFCNTRATCSAQARNIQNYHINTQKWCDIGYNFLIGEDGVVYEGRGWTTIGAHATPVNPISIGIAFFGSFTNRVPNNAALNAAKQLIACGVAKNFIKNNYDLKGHRNVMSTSCPGNQLYNLITGWPHFKA